MKYTYREGIESYADLKEGDTVIFSHHTVWGNTNRLRLVDRVTKTQIVVGGNKFRRSSGRIVGGGYNVPSIQIPKSMDELQSVETTYQLSLKHDRVKHIINSSKIKKDDIVWGKLYDVLAEHGQINL